MGSLIEVDRLSKRFGSTEVLRSMSFAAGAKKVVSVIGPSGSGKTTLLRCLAMLETPSAGEIRVHGVPVARPARSAGFAAPLAANFEQLIKYSAPLGRPRPRGRKRLAVAHVVRLRLEGHAAVPAAARIREVSSGKFAHSLLAVMPERNEIRGRCLHAVYTSFRVSFMLE
jgi:ABC-type multidrug transport system ATPase subunit